MYDPKSFAKALIEFASETLEDANLALQPSESQLRTLDAISLVLGEQLHRNGEDELIANFVLLELFDGQMEAAKDDTHKLEQKLRDMTTAVRLGLQIIGD